MDVDDEGVEQRTRVGEADCGSVVTMVGGAKRGERGMLVYVEDVGLLLVDLEDGDTWPLEGKEMCIVHPRAILLIAGRPEAE